MLHDLIPVAAATVVPALLCLATAYTLRSQGGRHTTGLVVKRPAGWSPYDGRVRQAIAHYAADKREPGLGVAR